MLCTEIEMQGDDRCCYQGCGKKTRSHGIAVEARGAGSAVGPPTLVGAVCHNHWSEVDTEAGVRDILMVLDIGRMHAAPLTVEQLAERQ